VLVTAHSILTLIFTVYVYLFASLVTFHELISFSPICDWCFRCALNGASIIDRVGSPSPYVTRFTETEEILPITIRVPAQGDFGGPDAIERNNITKLLGTEPDLLQKFRAKLKQRRWIECNKVCRFLIIYRSSR
jgi:hypothetical protein